MKIYGKILNGIKFKGDTYYHLGCLKHKDGTITKHDYEGPTLHAIAGCSGKATQFLDGQDSIGGYGFINDVMSWGYQGRGSDLMAGWLIMRAFCPWPSMDESRQVSKWQTETREIMLRHYKAFSEEVIANLPDEWEMDTDWVKAWVMKREKKLEVV